MSGEATPKSDYSRKPPSRVGPSSAEIGYAVVALCSFVAGLYALWVASLGTGLTANTFAFTNGRSGVGTAFSAAPASMWPTWIPVALVCLAGTGLIWMSFRALAKSSALATIHHSLALVESLHIPDAMKFAVMVAAVGDEHPHFAKNFATPLPDDKAIRTAAAGKWVLERFAEGQCVIAVAESALYSETLRSAVAQIDDRPIQVLQRDHPTNNLEGGT